MSEARASLWECCDDPDGVAAAMAAADQLIASLRDAETEQVRGIAADPENRDTIVGMLAVKELRRRGAE